MGRRKLTPEEKLARVETRALYHREYEAKNREKRTAQKAAWSAANKEREEAARLKRVAEDPEKYKLLRQASYRRNRATTLARQKTYAKRNPHVPKAATKKYNSAKQRATPPWLTAQDKALMAGLKATAMMLTATSGVRHTLDHVVPLQNDFVCGLNVPCNLQILSLELNCSKGNRVWPDMW